MTGDLFENLRDAMGCMYISDIRLDKNKKRAISIASYLKQKYYSEKQWNDLVDYLKHTPSGDIIDLSKRRELKKQSTNQRAHHNKPTDEQTY